MEEQKEEQKTEEPQNQKVDEDKQVIEGLSKYIQEMQFFSDQVKFNATLYQGISMILEKINKIESKLNETKK